MKGLLETVLVVEDDESTRRQLEDVLTASGFRVLTGANGADARRHISDDSPDVVVLDLPQPWISGVLARLRATPALKRTPVVAVTRMSRGMFALRAFGSVTVMRKPLNADEVVRTVQELLARKAF